MASLRQYARTRQKMAIRTILRLPGQHPRSSRDLLRSRGAYRPGLRRFLPRKAPRHTWQPAISGFEGLCDLGGDSFFGGQFLEPIFERETQRLSFRVECRSLFVARLNHSHGRFLAVSGNGARTFPSTGAEFFRGDSFFSSISVFDSAPIGAENAASPTAKGDCRRYRSATL